MASRPSALAVAVAAAVELSLAAGGAAATELSSLSGVWQQHGYGRLLVVDDGNATAYDINAVECHASEQLAIADLGEVVRLDARRLEIQYGLNRYMFDRQAALPEICRHTVDDSTPLQNFDSLWQTMHEHYAFFHQRGIDWDAMRQRYRPQIFADISDADLYRVLHEMIEQIGDGHARIEPPEDVLAMLKAEATAPAAAAGPGRFELGQQAQSSILRRYVPASQQHNAGAVRWGMINEDVGYLQVNHMLLLADYDVDTQLDMRAFFKAYFDAAEHRPYQYRDEVLGARAVVSRAVETLREARAVILDLRFNGGGKDEAALEFLRPFVREPVTVFTKKVRDGDGFAPAQPVVLEPVLPQHDGRLFVLTSSRTASAAEILVLASQRIDRSVRVGDVTEGIFSDTLDKTLPNGWKYTLSNEVYESQQGASFEGIGIAPDIRLDYPREASALYRRLRDDADPSGAGDAAIDAIIDIVARGERAAPTEPDAAIHTSSSLGRAVAADQQNTGRSLRFPHKYSCEAPCRG